MDNKDFENVKQDAKETLHEFSDNVNKTVNSQENKKILVGILAIVVGYLGVHKFILGYKKEGIIQLIATFVTCGIAGIVPLIEGIIYLTKTDEEFYNTYQLGYKGWF